MALTFNVHRLRLLERHNTSALCFLSRFWVSNDTLKFCYDTLNSESQDMLLTYIKVKRFE